MSSSAKEAHQSERIEMGLCRIGLDAMTCDEAGWCEMGRDGTDDVGWCGMGSGNVRWGENVLRTAGGREGEKGWWLLGCLGLSERSVPMEVARQIAIGRALEHEVEVGWRVDHLVQPDDVPMASQFEDPHLSLDRPRL